MSEAEQRYLDGARDDETIKALDREYIRSGRWVEAAHLCEDAATTTGEWRNKIWYLKRACSRYNRVKDMESFLRCHRKARVLVPDDVSAELKLDIWCPTGLATVYPNMGVATKALSQLSEIGKSIGEGWTIYGRFIYHFARSLVYRELQEWDGMIYEGKQFTGWAGSLSENDLGFLRMHSHIDENSWPELSGESGRCYCLCTVLTESIAVAQHAKMEDLSVTFSELDRWLGAYERFYHDAQHQADDNSENSNLRENADIYRQRVATCYGKAASTAYEAGRHEAASVYFAKSEQLMGEKIRGLWQFHKAAVFIALDRIEEAKSQIIETSGSVITNGLGLKAFNQIKEFDRIRDDPDIVKIVETWKALDE